MDEPSQSLPPLPSQDPPAPGVPPPATGAQTPCANAPGAPIEPGPAPTPSAPPPPPRPPAKPPLLPPPPLRAPPQPSKKGNAWRWVAIIALAALGLSLMGNLSKTGRRVVARESAGFDSDRRMEEVTLEHKSGDAKILVIDINGVISGSDSDAGGMGIVESVKEQLKLAAKDTDVKAVLLRVDSPGGEVLAADEINRAIVKFQNETKRPVIATMGSMAASGGYYISAPCRWIIANELTITGSIGVIMHGYNYRELMNKVGVVPETYKSGKFKDMLSSDLEPNIDKLNPEERETRLETRQMVQNLIVETFERFKTVVRAGRHASNAASPHGQALADNWENYADGRVFSGKQALALGFVDELGNFDAASQRARDMAGAPDASLIAYREPFHLGSLLSLLGKTETRSLKVDLGFNPIRLQAGRMYYIAPMVLE